MFRGYVFAVHRDVCRDGSNILRQSHIQAHVKATGICEISLYMD